MRDLDRLLILAALNLMVTGAILLPLALRRMYVGCQIAVAAVPGLWAVLTAAAYLYVRATMQPEFAVVRTGFFLGALGHGDLAAQAWDAHLGIATVVGGWITAATVFAVSALWLVCAIGARRQRVPDSTLYTPSA
jgi:hypothetical protein